MHTTQDRYCRYPLWHCCTSKIYTYPKSHKRSMHFSLEIIGKLCNYASWSKMQSVIFILNSLSRFIGSSKTCCIFYAYACGLRPKLKRTVFGAINNYLYSYVDSSTQLIYFKVNITCLLLILPICLKFILLLYNNIIYVGL